MRYITEDDFKIFDQEKVLDDLVKQARQHWLNEVKKSHQGLIKYEHTEPLFNEFLKTHNK